MASTEEVEGERVMGLLALAGQSVTWFLSSGVQSSEGEVEVRTETFYEDLDNITEAGRLFVALADRLEDSPGTLKVMQEGLEGVEMDAAHLAHALRVPIPPEWRGASIEVLPDDHEIVRTARRTTVVIDYPPVRISDVQVTARSFKKCVNFCKTVKGVKVCVQVCVDVSIGWDGVHGSFKATLTATF